MKEEGLAHWNSPNTWATNESGFTALPSGYRSYNNGNYYYKGTSGDFWSSSENSISYALNYNIDFLYSNVNEYSNYKGNDFGIRCLLD